METLMIKVLLLGYFCGWTIAITQEDDTTVEWPRKNPEIISLHYHTTINLRFATTEVTSRVVNHAEDAREWVFSVRIPQTAFMTNFSMEIDGRIQHGGIKESHQAKHDYARYKSKTHNGQGHKTILNHGERLRGFNSFKVNVNIRPKSDVMFNLTYQEFLARKLGSYHHFIDLDPGQIVENFTVDVDIKESVPIRIINVPPLVTSQFTAHDGNAENEESNIERASENTAHISYQPRVRRQLQTSPTGISGLFVVEYDVVRQPNSAQLFASSDFFVEYFSPAVSRPLPKNMLFVLDVSRSMSGVKLEQTKTAMAAVLEELRPGDMFNIITFSTVLRFWRKQGLHRPTPENIESSRHFIQNMQAGRGTNVNDALLRAIEVLRMNSGEATSDELRSSMIMFLVDGEPTAGIVSPDRILSNVKQANNGSIALFCLGMDKGVDFNFLKKLAVQNNGNARLVYSESDTAHEFHNFYSEIEKPLLSNVSFSYPEYMTIPTSLSPTNFPSCFDGSETVVTGRLSDVKSRITTTVTGLSITGMYRVTGRATATDSAYPNELLERIWAFLTIQRLLETAETCDNVTIHSTSTTRALDLSLKYAFVTPITTMVIVKHDEPHTNVGRFKPGDKEKRRKSHPGTAARRNRNPSFVDNDPHFIIMLNGIDEGICFDVDGNLGDIYQLIYDDITGVIVNGLVVGKKTRNDNSPSTKNHQRTYFGTISILYEGGSVYLTPKEIIINNKEIDWRTSTKLSDHGVHLDITASRNATVRLKCGIVFVVLRHIVHKPHPSKVDYLGFYIKDGSRLSKYTHGLIGQFQHQTCQFLKAPYTDSNGHTIGEFVLQGANTRSHDVKARLSKRRNMELNIHVPCWHIGNNGQKLLEGDYSQYRVPSLHFRKFSRR